MMKRILIGLAVLCLTICAGCADTETAESEVTPTPVETATPLPETLSPSPTEDPTPTPTAAPKFTIGEKISYVLFEGTTDGGKALSLWLRSDGKEVIKDFIPDGLDVPMYTAADETSAEGEFPAVTDETRHLRVVADIDLLKSGLLSALLPAFEAETGYICEIYAGDTPLLSAEAEEGTADILLIKENDVSEIGSIRNHYPASYKFVSTEYSIG